MACAWWVRRVFAAWRAASSAVHHVHVLGGNAQPWYGMDMVWSCDGGARARRAWTWLRALGYSVFTAAELERMPGRCTRGAAATPDAGQLTMDAFECVWPDEGVACTAELVLEVQPRGRRPSKRARRRGEQRVAREQVHAAVKRARRRGLGSASGAREAMVHDTAWRRDAPELQRAALDWRRQRTPQQAAAHGAAVGTATSGWPTEQRPRKRPRPVTRATDERFDLIWHLQERRRLRALAAETAREAAALDADTAARRAEEEQARAGATEAAWRSIGRVRHALRLKRAQALMRTTTGIVRRSRGAQACAFARDRERILHARPQDPVEWGGRAL